MLKRFLPARTLDDMRSSLIFIPDQPEKQQFLSGGSFSPVHPTAPGQARDVRAARQCRWARGRRKKELMASLVSECTPAVKQ